MQLMRSKKKGKTVGRKACKGLWLTKKYLFTISPAWNLRKKPSFLLTKSVFKKKISHSSHTALSQPQNLQIMVDPVAGVTAFRQQNSVFLPLQIPYASVTSPHTVLNTASLPHWGCMNVNRLNVKWCKALWGTAWTKGAIKIENLHSNPVRQVKLVVTVDLIITTCVKKRLYGSQKWLSILGTLIWDSQAFHGITLTTRVGRDNLPLRVLDFAETNEGASFGTGRQRMDSEYQVTSFGISLKYVEERLIYLMCVWNTSSQKLHLLMIKLWLQTSFIFTEK